jgi:acyl-CoA synthetase (AMP-forming)/AMP-acid ligase II
MTTSSLAWDPHQRLGTLVDLVRWRAAIQPEQWAFTFLVDGGAHEVHLTYAALDLRARAIAAQLQTITTVGERALLLYPPGLDFIEAFLGCVYAGVIAVPVCPPRPHRDSARSQSIQADAQARLALTTSAHRAKLVPLFASDDSTAAPQWLATDEVANTWEHNWTAPLLTERSLAFLQYTSGSTGHPKGVMVSHGNVMHNEALIYTGFAPSEARLGMSWLPAYHDMGLIGGLLQPLFGGFHCVLMSPAAFIQCPFRWLKAISHYRVTISGGPNLAYDLCVRKITPEQRTTLDLSCWSVAFSGAEPVRAESLERFAQTFADCGFRAEAFFPCYGLAEATLMVTTKPCRSGPPKICHTDKAALQQNRAVERRDGTGVVRVVSCGKVLCDQIVLIVDPERATRCHPGEVGEIWVSGPSVAQGYWRRSVETAATFRGYGLDMGEGPFLRTGDLGFEHDGELYVTGRLKDLIIIGGRNHYPQDIEQTVKAVDPALCTGAGAAFSIEVAGEERVVVLQEVELPAKADLDRLIGAMRLAVAREHEIELYGIMLLKPGRLPKTSSGKLQRKLCRLRFLEGSFELVGGWLGARNGLMALPSLSSRSGGE